MSGRMGDQQCKAQLGERALPSNLSGKTNKDLTGGGKPFPVSEQWPGINHVDAKPYLAGESGYWHCHLARPKDEEIRTIADDVDEYLYSGMSISLDLFKGAVQIQGPGDTVR